VGLSSSPDRELSENLDANRASVFWLTPNAPGYAIAAGKIPAEKIAETQRLIFNSASMPGYPFLPP